METTGQRIRKLRKNLKMTQKELGRLIGVSAATVTQWEKDDTVAKGDNADRLTEILGTSWSFLRTGVDNGETPKPVIATALETPLFDRANAALHLKGENAKALKSVSSIAVPEKVRSPKVFAMTEDMEGMAPLINKNDYVFISPDLPMKADTNSAFWVNNSPIIGHLAQTPAGMSLRFISDAPGWEAVSVTNEDYIGRVIAIDPVWARQQRED